MGQGRAGQCGEQNTSSPLNFEGKTLMCETPKLLEQGCRDPLSGEGEIKVRPRGVRGVGPAGREGEGARKGIQGVRKMSTWTEIRGGCLSWEVRLSM